MIDFDDEAMDAVTDGNFQYRMKVDAYYNGKLIYADVPFSSGYEEVDTTNNVPERYEFRIPRVVDGYDWSPIGTLHPLAANGQQLRVTLGVGTSGNEPFWFRRSVLRVDQSEVDGDEVTVQGVGLLERIQVADFIGPFQPSGTLGSTVRDLCGSQLPVWIDDDLDDRDIPSGLVFGDSRIQALYQVLDAWPALCRVTASGVLWVYPASQSRTPLFSLVHGLGGTIISSSGYSSSEGDWNCVGVRYTDADGTPGQQIAFLTDNNNPKRFGGPNNKLEMPFWVDSDIVKTNNEASASASAILRRKAKQTSNSYDIEMVPNPSLETGDVGTITTDQVTNQLVEITAMTMPYTHDSGSMKLTVVTV